MEKFSVLFWMSSSEGHHPWPQMRSKYRIARLPEMKKGKANKKVSYCFCAVFWGGGATLPFAFKRHTFWVCPIFPQK